MAFFRCGGSGIPASLKSGMNSVLNKKFGTSTTYDPAGWPADVNLLGPLPVKTASGAIASFVDGADGVPVKSCSVSFLPSGGGGTPSAPVAIVGHSGITLTNKDNMSTPTHTDTYTDTFGQTIYGGTRDLTTDKASVTADLFALDDANITWDYRADNKVFRSSVLSISQILLCSCFGVETYSHVYNNAETYDNCIAISSGKRLFVSYQGASGDVNAFKSAISGQKLVVGLDTPTEITGLTPHEIDTFYGDNNIYSNAPKSTTSVTYYADQSLIPDTSTRSLQLSPLPEVDEEVVDEEVEEGVDDMR